MRRGYLYSALILISAAALIMQLALTRLFALIEWYHLAFLIISVALLGYGLSGTLLALLPPARRRGLDGVALALPVSIVLAYLVINLVPFDSYQLAWDARQLFYLAVYYVTLILPFGINGLLVASWLSREPDIGNRLYGLTLIGSALGAASLLVLLPALGAEGATMAAAAVAAVGAGCALLSRPPNRPRTWGAAAAGITALLLGVLALRPPAWLPLRMSPYKSLSYALQPAAARLALQRWTVNARVDVIESPHIHSAPGLSLSYQGRLPPQHGITLDAGSLSPITRRIDEEDERFLAHLPTAPPFALRPKARALVLLPRGGMDVAVALHGGARAVEVVEDHAAVAQVVQERYEAWTGGLYRDPRVTLHRQDMRSALRLVQRPFDVVILSLTDSYHPLTTGSYSLSEDYRYTVEAMSAALDVLADDGVLVVTRWLQDPPSESLRMAATLVTALEERATGPSPAAAPGEHLMAYRTWSTMTLLVSPTPFAVEDTDQLREACHALGYDLVHVPGIRREETNRFNILSEPVYHQAITELLASSDRRAWYRRQPFDVTPTRDDRPFFGHYFRWRQLPGIVARLGRTWEPFGGSGFLLVLTLLLLAILGAAVLILLPILWRHRSAIPQGRRWPIIVYFSGLGFGFLAIEIPLMQQFILYLGQPALSFIVVLAALLLFSGLGSLLARRVPLRLALGGLLLAILVYRAGLGFVLGRTIGYPLALRGAITLGGLLPLGLLMGIPFAGGLGLLERSLPGVTPWAWAINGSTSVVGSVLAAILALSGGFGLVLLFAALCYGAALVAAWTFVGDEGRLSDRPSGAQSAPPSPAQR